MKETAENLKDVIHTVSPVLQQLNEKQAMAKPKPDKWSPKEIIGHLIDSAVNNQIRFVRSNLKEDFSIAGYKQDEWVATQHYQDYEWLSLLKLWSQLNLHVVHIMSHTQENCLKNKIRIDGEEAVELDFLMIDYVEHLKHHLKQILPDL